MPDSTGAASRSARGRKGKVPANLPAGLAAAVDAAIREGRTWAGSRDAFVRAAVEAALRQLRQETPYEASLRWAERELMIELMERAAGIRREGQPGNNYAGPEHWLRQSLLIQMRAPARGWEEEIRELRGRKHLKGAGGE